MQGENEQSEWEGERKRRAKGEIASEHEEKGWQSKEVPAFIRRHRSRYGAGQVGMDEKGMKP